MTRTKNGHDLKQEVPDPITRLEILIDGDEGLGVKGLRGRVTRVERLVMVSIGLTVIYVVAQSSGGPLTDALLMTLLKALTGG